MQTTYSCCRTRQKMFPYPSSCPCQALQLLRSFLCYALFLLMLLLLLLGCGGLWCWGCCHGGCAECCVGALSFLGVAVMRGPGCVAAVGWLGPSHGSPIAYACHSSGAAFQLQQRNQQMIHNRKEISAWCLHKDKEENSNCTQLDKSCKQGKKV